MKNLVVVAFLILGGCASTTTICDTDPNVAVCDSSNYSSVTKEALEKFDDLRSVKSFALARSEDGSEALGYSYGYSSKRKANERALLECRVSARRLKIKSPCEIIR